MKKLNFVLATIFFSILLFGSHYPLIAAGLKIEKKDLHYKRVALGWNLDLIDGVSVDKFYSELGIFLPDIISSLGVDLELNQGRSSIEINGENRQLNTWMVSASLLGRWWSEAAYLTLYLDQKGWETNLLESDTTLSSNNPTNSGIDLEESESFLATGFTLLLKEKDDIEIKFRGVFGSPVNRMEQFPKKVLWRLDVFSPQFDLKLAIELRDKIGSERPAERRIVLTKVMKRGDLTSLIPDKLKSYFGTADQE